MSATKCRTCKDTIARHIKRCPHCGEDYPDISDVMPTGTMAFGVIPIIRASKKTRDERKEKENSLKKAQAETLPNFLTSFATATAITVIGLGIKALVEKKKVD